LVTTIKPSSRRLGVKELAVIMLRTLAPTPPPRRVDQRPRPQANPSPPPDDDLDDAPLWETSHPTRPPWWSRTPPAEYLLGHFLLLQCPRGLLWAGAILGVDLRNGLVEVRHFGPPVNTFHEALHRRWLAGYVDSADDTATFTNAAAPPRTYEPWTWVTKISNTQSRMFVLERAKMPSSALDWPP
jgi:hypothetical protein